MAEDYVKINILVHSFPNRTEVMKTLLEMSRKGYLVVLSASAYLAMLLLHKFSPVMNEGASMLTFICIALDWIIPGYNVGMSSTKAQLKSNTCVLYYKAAHK